MAFTISHAVLAPLLNRISGQNLPIAALAIGCMTPDLYRLFTTINSNTTHLWTHIFYPTLWIGLGFCFIWYSLYRPVLYRFLGIQDPLNLYSLKKTLTFILMTTIAVVIGICTHLIWDGLTHVDFRTFAFHEFLSQNIQLFAYNYPMHRILQIGTSALALPFIIWMAIRYYQNFYQRLSVSKAIRSWAWIILIASFCLGLFSFIDYIRHIPAEYMQTGIYHFTGRSINEFSQGFLITFSLGCLLFLFLDRGRRLG